MINSMEKVELNKEKINSILIYSIAILLCVIILVISFKLWKADLSVPFTYDGDGLSVGTYIKGIVDNNSMLMNKYIGTPSLLSAAETPMSDWLHIFIIRFLTIITHNYALTLNLYYLLTFPLVTVTALYVFLKFKINSVFSVVGSLIYTFLPYHIMRGENHLFLSAYYLVPISCMLILIVWSDNNLIFNFKNPSNNIFSFECIYKVISVLIVCLLIASSGVYYAFFTCFFLLLSGLFVSIRSKSIKKFWISIVLISMIVFGNILNVIPNLIYNHNHEKSTVSIKRSPVEAEIYGLKISQLLLPVTGHSIPFISSEKDKYDKQAPLINENGTATLGIIGSIGFLMSIAYLYSNKKDSLIESLGLLNLSAILLASIGGISTFVAFFITDMIRAYNRISVFIAFFSLFAFFYVLSNLYNKYMVKYKTRVLFLALSLFILFIGIFDEIPPRYIPNYDSIKNEYLADELFVKTIERTVKPGIKIFQLPYIPFPENPSPYKMGYYDLFRPYLHSNNLYWSYGSIQGKENDRWQKSVASEPIKMFLADIYAKGFRGVYLDSYGYKDTNESNKIVNEISASTNSEPLYSADKRFVFINLSKYTPISK